MLTLEQRDIALPEVVRAWVDRAAAVPCVQSVVLFGSRAMGCAGEHSDWDIAIIHGDDGVVPDDLVSASYEFSSKHGALVIPETRWIDQKDHYSTLPNEVIAHGVLIRGVNHEDRSMPPKQSDPKHASVQFRALSKNALRHAAAGIQDLAACRQDGFSSVEPGMAKEAADAVELAAKLLCLSRGVSFAQSHKLHEIVEDLPEEWQERLLPLNGDLHSDHMAGYGLILSSYAEGGPKAVYDRNRTRVEGALAIMRILAQENMPLVASDRVQLLKSLSGPHRPEFNDATRDVEPALCAEFDTARDDWSRRLAHDLDLARKAVRREPPVRGGGMTR